VGHVEGEETLDLDLRQKRGRVRQFRVNNRSILRQRDWVGQVPLVSFSPEEMDLVKGEPAVRRRALERHPDPSGRRIRRRLWPLHQTVGGAERRAPPCSRRFGETGEPGTLEPVAFDRRRPAHPLPSPIPQRIFSLGFKKRQADAFGGPGSGNGALSALISHSLQKRAAPVEDVNRRRFAELADGEIALGSTLIGPHPGRRGISFG
jgi:hypothetical protein